MKKFLFLAVIAIMSLTSVFGAAVGNGLLNAMIPAQAIAGQQITAMSWTFSATSAIDGPGVVGMKWPTGFGTPLAARFTLGGTATEAKKIAITSEGTQYYIWISCTVSNTQTITVIYSNGTVTATTGASSFTWYEADDATTTYTATALSAAVSVYAWSANKAAAVGTVGPSPIIVSGDTTNFSAQMVWGVSPVYGGQVRWSLAVGTPGYATTPNPLTFLASTTNAKNNCAWIKATPASLDTPVCNATECYANVLAAATISIGDKFEIRYGPPTVAATVTPWHGSNYAKNMKMNIKVNAANPATTETPVSYPTESESGNFLLQVETPTLVITPIIKNQNQALYKVSAKKNADLWLKANGTPVSAAVRASGANDNLSLSGMPAGKATMTVLQGFYDNANEGAYRTVTSNGDTYINIGNWADYTKAVLDADSLINYEALTSGSEGTGYSAVTNYAQDRLLISVSATSALATTYQLVIGGTSTASTTNAGGTIIGSASYAANGLAAIILPAGMTYIPAGTYIKISLTTATSGARTFNWATVKVSDLTLVQE